MHPVPERALRGRLPRGRAHPAVRRAGGRGRLRARLRYREGRERAARHLRSRVPAGDAVRGRVHARQKRRAGGHRALGALRVRLGVRPSQRGRGRAGCAARGVRGGRRDGVRHRAQRRRSGVEGSCRQARGRRRVWPGIPHVRRRAGEARVRRHGVRGVAQGWRRADLRHPRVSSAEGARGARGGEAWRDRRVFRDERSGGKALRHRRAHGRARVRRRVRGHGRRASQLSGHRGRGP